MPDRQWGPADAQEAATLWIWTRMEPVPEVVRIETQPPERVMEGYRVQEVRVMLVTDGPAACGPYARREVERQRQTAPENKVAVWDPRDGATTRADGDPSARPEGGPDA